MSSVEKYGSTPSPDRMSTARDNMRTHASEPERQHSNVDSSSSASPEVRNCCTNTM
jgi:hypothetical protein